MQDHVHSGLQLTILIIILLQKIQEGITLSLLVDGYFLANIRFVIVFQVQIGLKFVFISSYLPGISVQMLELIVINQVLEVVDGVAKYVVWQVHPLHVVHIVIG